jgi:hypothetical protein
MAAEVRASTAESEARLRALEIERLKLLLAKARREQYGHTSERGLGDHRPARRAGMKHHFDLDVPPR